MYKLYNIIVLRGYAPRYAAAQPATTCNNAPTVLLLVQPEADAVDRDGVDRRAFAVEQCLHLPRASRRARGESLGSGARAQQRPPIHRIVYTHHHYGPA